MLNIQAFSVIIISEFFVLTDLLYENKDSYKERQFRIGKEYRYAEYS